MHRSGQVFKFAVVGCGMISEYHIDAINQIEEAELAGVYDRTFEKAKAVAEKYQVTAYPSYKDLLQDATVDVVCICTPSYLHAPQALEAISHKKSVLIEKPIALTLEDCDDLILEARKNQVLVGVVSQLRFSPDVIKVKQVLEDGLLGRLTRGDLYMKYYRAPEYYQQGGWRGTSAKDGGGALMNQGIHGVDLLLYLLGPARSIIAQSATLVHDIEVEDTLSALVRFQNDAIGVIEASTADWPGSLRRIEIHGERGVIALEEDRISKWEIRDQELFLGVASEAAQTNTTFNNPRGMTAIGHVRQMCNFIQALREGEQELVTNAEQGRKALQLILAAYASAKDQCPISW